MAIILRNYFGNAREMAARSGIFRNIPDLCTDFNMFLLFIKTN